MLILASANEQLDDLLEQLCLGLALNDTQHTRAARAYETVGAWLSAEDSLLAPFRPLLFPQGSIPLGTAVKPRSKEEFDADGVCLFRAAEGLSPRSAYDLVFMRLTQHETYRDKLSAEDRCLRINYEGQLHLDIIPATPSPMGTPSILVPTSGRSGWQPSNPVGFQNWFEARQGERLLMEKTAQVVPMPPNQPPTNKSPLQRTAQLFKRRRDVYFGGADEAPKSILLTTIVAEVFAQERLVTDATLHALERMAQRFSPHAAPVPVWNPSNTGENLARQWQEAPASYRAFVDFTHDFYSRMRRLLTEKGMEKIAEILRDLFDPLGSGVVENAVRGYTQRLQDQRLSGGIGVSRNTGGLGSRVPGAPRTALASIPVNRFFGRSGT